MNNILIFASLLSLCGMISAPAQSPSPPSPPKNTTNPKPPAPTKLNLVRYQGKTGKPSTNVKVSTRAGDEGSIRIVAIAPGNEGTTFKPQPRFWWHQTETTRAGELEFVLTRLSSDAPADIFRRSIPAMKIGFNVIDLSILSVNPDSIALEKGATYRWTINVRRGLTSSPVYSQLTLQNDPNPAISGTAIEERLRILGEQGNWYELFDLVSSEAQKEVPLGPMHQLRKELLTGIKLIGEIK